MPNDKQVITALEVLNKIICTNRNAGAFEALCIFLTAYSSDRPYFKKSTCHLCFPGCKNLEDFSWQNLSPSFYRFAKNVNLLVERYIVIENEKEKAFEFSFDNDDNLESYEFISPHENLEIKGAIQTKDMSFAQFYLQLIDTLKNAQPERTLNLGNIKIALDNPQNSEKRKDLYSRFNLD